MSLNHFTSQIILPPAKAGEHIVLEADNVSKRYAEGSGSELTILNGINLTIRSGEKIAIVGASGCGKSTLLHLLGGLDQPTSGHVLIDNQDFAGMTETQRCRIRNRNLGFIYQFHHLLPEFTALENVAMPMYIRGSSTRKAMERARLLLEKVGMIGRLHHKPAELSGGERQRTAIARALCAEPKCILADEPTGNLDPATAEQVVDVIFKLNRDFHTSLVIVTHDRALADKMDSIYTIENGHLSKIK
jgi:lipoprotein-releasing system ATP-binding protein